MSPPKSPKTTAEFFQMFPSERACEAYLAAWRWPDGVQCPRCASRQMGRHEGRHLWQCTGCRYQVSVTAGTVMHRSKTSLQTWMYAFWAFAVRKTSISALQLQTECGLRSYKTAWALLQKVRRVMLERDEWQLGAGKVEVDESMVGGRAGRRARHLGWDGAWLLTAVERITVKTKTRTYTRSGSARTAVVRKADEPTLLDFVAKNVKEGATVVTDGFTAYQHVGELGVRHEATAVNGSKHLLDTVLPKVHLLTSNLKTWVNGTFHGVSGRYLGLYAREFTYRFNRRHLGPAVFGFVVRRIMHGTWVPTAKLLQPAEATG